MTDKIDPVNLEILRMAKEIVINEYTDRRAQDHNTWLKNSEELWRTKKQKLPYPEIPPYPTEYDIVKRAQILFGFLKDNQIEVESPAPAEPIVEPVAEPIVEDTKPIEKEDLLKSIREKEQLLTKLKFSQTMKA